MKFLSDGRLVAQWGRYRTNVWNITSGQYELTFPYACSTFEEMNNGLLAMGCSSNIYLSNLTNGTLVATISQGSTLYFLKQTNYQNYLASTDTTGTIYLWNASSYSLVKKFKLYAISKTILENLASGYLLSASFDGLLQIWNISTSTCLNTYIPFYGAINSLTMLSNNTFALISPYASSSIVVFQIDDNFKFNMITNLSLPVMYGVTCLCLTNENSLLASTGSYLNYINLNSSLLTQSVTVSFTDSVNQFARMGKI
jgi:WD40 repeat protein